MQESGFLVLLIVSLFFVVFFLIFILGLLPLWSFAECLSMGRRSKRRKFAEAFFIVAIWPISPLIYAMFFSRVFMLRFCAAVSAVLIVASGSLVAARWDQVKLVYPELSYVAANVLDTAGGVTGAINYASSAVDADAAGDKVSLESTVVVTKAPVVDDIVSPVAPLVVKDSLPDMMSLEDMKPSKIVRSHYSGGELRSEHTFREGLLEGPSRTYYKSGGIMYHRIYDGGNLCRIKKYAEDGTLEFDTDYRS